MAVDLSILIITYNTKELTANCLNHIQNSKDRLTKEIIIVDNGSEDGTADHIRSHYPHVHLIALEENLGFNLGNNIAYEQASGKVLLLLNSDAFIGENTLQEAYDYLQTQKDVAIVGCRASDGEGNPLPSARNFPTPWRIFLMKMGLTKKLPYWKKINEMNHGHKEAMECDWVTGCCLFIRNSVVKQLSYLLDPEIFMYNDDNDLCFRVKRLGYRVMFLPLPIIHLGGGTELKQITQGLDPKEKLMVESDYLYFRKNYHLPMLLWYFFLLELFSIICILKRSLFINRNISIKKELERMRFYLTLLIKTNFGTYFTLKKKTSRH